MTKNNPTSKAKSWRDIFEVYPTADIFPMLPPDELKALADDIQANGLAQQILIADNPNDDAEKQWTVLDGRNRLCALESLSVELFTVQSGRVYPDWQYFTNDTGGREKSRRTIRSLNLLRRHLTAEQKRAAIEAMLKATPEQSDRQIGKAAKVDGKTVAKVRTKMEGRAEIPHVEKRTDTKGRQQPAQRLVTDKTDNSFQGLSPAVRDAAMSNGTADRSTIEALRKAGDERAQLKLNAEIVQTRRQLETADAQEAPELETRLGHRHSARVRSGSAEPQGPQRS